MAQLEIVSQLRLPTTTHEDAPSSSADDSIVLQPDNHQPLEDTKPHLKPSDLEDIAMIFDKIRILNKKKNDFSGDKKKLASSQPLD